MTAKENVKKYLDSSKLTKEQKSRLKSLDTFDEIREKNGKFCPVAYKLVAE